jgi:hypothetical protein
MVFMISGAVAMPQDVSTMTGPEIAQAVSERSSGERRLGSIRFSTSDEKGRTRTRKALLAVGDIGETHGIVLSFTAPSSIKDTGFLSHNHDDPAADDETWLFLPATDKVRRVPTSDRSDSFVGTELSYGDVKDDFKFGLSDYIFDRGSDTGGRVVLIGKAVDDTVADEIGYGGFRAEIDPATWFPHVIAFSGTDGAPLKTITVEATELVGSVLVATRFLVENHRDDRVTLVEIESMAPKPDLADRVFEATYLDRVSARIR